MYNTASSIILLLSCLYISAANGNLKEEMETLGREVANEIAEKAFSQFQNLTFHLLSSNVKFFIGKPLEKRNSVEMFHHISPSFRISIKYDIKAEVNNTENNGHLLLNLTCDLLNTEFPCEHPVCKVFPEQLGNIKSAAKLIVCGFESGGPKDITGKKVKRPWKIIDKLINSAEWKGTHDMKQMLRQRYGEECLLSPSTYDKNATMRTVAEKCDLIPDTSYSF